MVGLFSHLGDLADEANAVHEGLELKALADGVVLVLPSGQRLILVAISCAGLILNEYAVHTIDVGGKTLTPTRC